MRHGEYQSYRDEILEELGPDEESFLPFAPLFYAAILFVAGVFLAQVFYLRFHTCLLPAGFLRFRSEWFGRNDGSFHCAQQAILQRANRLRRCRFYCSF